jgi:pilus assembly protein TadC
MGILVALKGWLFSIFGPLSNSNLTIFFLASLTVILIVSITYLPTIEDLVIRANFGSNRKNFSTRMLRQFQAIRPSSHTTFRDNLRENLYRAGRSNDIIETNSDFFIFLRLVLAFALFGFAGLWLNVAHASPFILLLPFMGYVLPLVLAQLHNRARRKQIMDALPNAMPRLATAFSIDTYLLPMIFSKVAESDIGPLYDELDWAAGQMALAVRDPYEVIRQLDSRNNITFFGRLADDIERGSGSSESNMRKAAQDYIDEALSEYYADYEKRIGNLPNKVIIAVGIPMVIGIMVVVMGPVGMSLIGQLTRTVGR